MDYITELTQAINSADTSGFEDMIFAMVKMFAENFDLRTVDTTTIASLLTKFSFIWNPMWELVNKFLGSYFNF